MAIRDRFGKWALSWPPLVYLILFFLVPSLIMVVAAFRNPGDYGGLAPMYYLEEGKLVWDLTLDNFYRLVEEPLYIELFIKSAGYAGITTVVCLLMAYPLAWLIARSGKKYRDLMLLLVILPFWSNFLIRIYAWMIILGPQSAFTKMLNVVVTSLGFEPVRLLFTPFAVIVGLVYVHLPFMVLPLYANLEKHDMSLLDAAQDLGANAWQRFWRVTWPLSLPGVFAGSALVFIPALGMFAIPDILGGTDSIMIGNLIKQQILDTRDWPFGSVLSIMLTGGVLLIAALGAMVGRGGKKRG
ncbi:spermidine/putrescine transport system permease protein [Chromobacterium alkanivorans]|uniref:ABC transporter permease n=1 Tax=Chromobacterium alkanivorans TaxID=1071719 RepID=UPI0021684FE5|nr:ABC transporter permease [Chromobacterium alkanivorans]MCS3805231.1 spermidine/putrescine transport system permease protein [Chromobacterium alkanivorans]MCS3819570.1 spermidine/putrescine transport system permease protein [Chromobacterium alkanivorans]MCS3874455.1 spermidine/putrescine transport system permease protein [Chromobacterium alkanivorans]